MRYLAGQGIRQFLDIGSGIPTVGNVHEIAHRYAPDNRIAYVDIDPVAIIHSRHILGDDPRCRAVQGDLRAPDRLLAEPLIAEFLDFTRPVAVLLVAVLHFLPEFDRPGEVVARLRAALAPGSYLVISPAGWPPDETPEVRRARQNYERTTTPLILREAEDVAGFFGDFTLVEPGLVTVANWRPDGTAPHPADRTDRLPALAGVGVRNQPSATR